MVSLERREDWGEAMRSELATRRQVAQVTPRRCVRESMEQKGRFWAEFVGTIGYTRSYAPCVLRGLVPKARSSSTAVEESRGGNALRHLCKTLTVTDVPTGRTEIPRLGGRLAWRRGARLIERNARISMPGKAEALRLWRQTG
jgi:hypothetical protein